MHDVLILAIYKYISHHLLLRLLQYTSHEKEQSQTLRSALEDKARKQPSGGTGRNTGKAKRKMKPGQSKSLSDLPQLSA